MIEALNLSHSSSLQFHVAQQAELANAPNTQYANKVAAGKQRDCPQWQCDLLIMVQYR